MVGMHGDDAVIPDHLSHIIVYFHSCFCQEIDAENHIILTRIIIKDDECTLLCNAVILIKLW